jgi:hypothetical protein
MSSPLSYPVLTVTVLDFRFNRPHHCLLRTETRSYRGTDWTDGPTEGRALAASRTSRPGAADRPWRVSRREYP